VGIRQRRDDIDNRVAEAATVQRAKIVKPVLERGE
jgi:hypothetical protein